jgi:hypothetical protein
MTQSALGNADVAFLLVVVLVLGSSGFLDCEHKDDDENEPSPTSCKHALSTSGVSDHSRRISAADFLSNVRVGR